MDELRESLMHEIAAAALYFWDAKRELDKADKSQENPARGAFLEAEYNLEQAIEKLDALDLLSDHLKPLLTAA